MPTPPLPGGRSTRRAITAALAAAAAAALVTASAQAGLIPPAGPWPAAVAGADPLTSTAAPLNGASATANASLRVWLPVGSRHRSALTRTIGARTVVRGRLTNRDTRHSIADAFVVLAAQSVYGGDWAAAGIFPTDRKGRFRAVLPAGESRRTAVLYWPASNAPAPVYSRRLLVRASARSYLARPYRKHRSFRFDGRVSGAPIPAGGLLIALQVRNRRGNWVTARLAHTHASGRYRVRYRFPPGRLTVRVSVPAQAGWPLYGGHSHPRRIRVP